MNARSAARLRPGTLVRATTANDVLPAFARGSIHRITHAAPTWVNFEPAPSDGTEAGLTPAAFAAHFDAFECDACASPTCPTPVAYEARPSDWRNCEEPGCHAQGPLHGMVLLFRECWYCPPHAIEQLDAAAAERQLTPEEIDLAHETRALHSKEGSPS